jgi:tetratricopeptide (TPR) repeat protein
MAGCQGRQSMATALLLLMLLTVAVFVSWRRAAQQAEAESGEYPPSKPSVPPGQSDGVPALPQPMPPEEQLRQLTQAVSAAVQAGDLHAECAAVRELAEAYFVAGAHEEAARHFRLCAERALVAGEPAVQGQALLKLGYTYVVARKLLRACEVYEEAAALGRAQQSPQLLASALDRLADSYALQQQWEKAAGAARERLAVAEQRKDARATFAALLRLGDLHLQLRDEQQGLHYLRRAIAEAQANDRLSDESRALCRLAKAHLLIGQPHEVVALLKDKLERALGWSDSFDGSRVLTVLADACLELAEPRRAAQLFERHRESLRHANEDKAYLLARLCCAYVQLGERDLAQQRLAEAQAISDKDGGLLPSTVEALGMAYLDLGEPRRALALGLAALEQARKRGSIPDECLALLGIGRAHLQLSEPQRAAERLLRALELLRHSDRRLESLIYEQLAQALENTGDRAAAAQALHSRLDYLRYIRHPQADAVAAQVAALSGATEALPAAPLSSPT